MNLTEKMYKEKIYLSKLTDHIFIQCETEKEVESLFNKLDKAGYRWNIGQRLIEGDNCWKIHGKNTCYSLNKKTGVIYSHINKVKDKNLFKFKDVVFFY